MLRSSREASAVVPLEPPPSNRPGILKRAQRQTVQPVDRNTQQQQQFNICASGFILCQIPMRCWGCQPCGGAVGASPEGRETLHSCCQWTAETRRSWSWWWRSSNRGPRHCHRGGMNLQTAWSVLFRLSSTITEWCSLKLGVAMIASVPSKYWAEGSAGELGVRQALSGLAWGPRRGMSHTCKKIFKVSAFEGLFFSPLPLPAVMDWTETSLYASGCRPDRPWAKGWAGWSGSRWRTAAGQRRPHQPRAGQERPVEGRAWRVRPRPCCCIAQKLWPHPGGWGQRTGTGTLDRKMTDLIGQQWHVRDVRDIASVPLSWASGLLQIFCRTCMMSMIASKTWKQWSQTESQLGGFLYLVLQSHNCTFT